MVQGDGSPLRAPLQQRLRQDNFSGLIKKSHESSLRPTLLTTEEKPGKRYTDWLELEEELKRLREENRGLKAMLE